MLNVFVFLLSIRPLFVSACEFGAHGVKVSLALCWALILHNGMCHWVAALVCSSRSTYSQREAGTFRLREAKACGPAASAAGAALWSWFGSCRGNTWIPAGEKSHWNAASSCARARACETTSLSLSASDARSWGKRLRQRPPGEKEEGGGGEEKEKRIRALHPEMPVTTQSQFPRTGAWKPVLGSSQWARRRHCSPSSSSADVMRYGGQVIVLGQGKPEMIE